MLNLTEPTLLLDKQKCLRNIAAIVEKAKRNHVRLRPHFKTHQSHEVGQWFRDLGVEKITVSSLRMAEYFADDNWADITVAIPVNVNEHERINQLAQRISLNLIVVSAEAIQLLGQRVQYPVNLFIEIDNGYHRTGVLPTDFTTIDLILDQIKKFPQLTFAGFLGHAGHSYKANGDKNKILQIHKESIACMQPLKQRYINEYPNLILSTGDTPTCSVAEDFFGVDEIRPGNLVFYDVTQNHIGSCTLDQIAVAMACPVIAIYPERNEIVIHGGAVHFSKDSLTTATGQLHFGKVIKLTDSGWNTDKTGMFIKSLSQEHGILHATKNQCEKIKVGDFMGVLPVHSCLTADMTKSYLTLEGERISKI
jgi:D-serine deaminase-like pyridoxal phosphate-dependent protein